MHAEDRILSKTEIEQEPAAVTIFRDVRDAELTPHARTERLEISSFEVDLARDARGIGQSRECFDQLSLTIAFDSGVADDLTATNFERHVVNALRASVISD